MKTEFKVGQKVWDEIHFPGEEGVIQSIEGNEEIGIELYVSFPSEDVEYSVNGAYIIDQTPTLKPYPYTLEFKEKKFEPVVGRYYYFWDDSKAVAIYDRFKQMQGNTYLPEYATFGFENISETPPFK